MESFLTVNCFRQDLHRCQPGLPLRFHALIADERQWGQTGCPFHRRSSKYFRALASSRNISANSNNPIALFGRYFPFIAILQRMLIGTMRMRLRSLSGKWREKPRFYAVR
jgi:hypothetical protein